MHVISWIAAQNPKIGFLCSGEYEHSDNLTRAWVTGVWRRQKKEEKGSPHLHAIILKCGIIPFLSSSIIHCINSLKKLSIFMRTVCSSVLSEGGNKIDILDLFADLAAANPWHHTLGIWIYPSIDTIPLTSRISPAYDGIHPGGGKNTSLQPPCARRKIWPWYLAAASCPLLGS